MNGINLAMWILAVDEWKFASLRFPVFSPNRPGLSRQNHIYPRTICGGADRSGGGEWWPDTGPCLCPWAPPPRHWGSPARSSPGYPAPWTDIHIIPQYMTKRQRQFQMREGGTRWLAARVADPDPNWIRIQSGQWIRIRIRNPDPDPGGQKWPTKVEKKN